MEQENDQKTQISKISFSNYAKPYAKNTTYKSIQCKITKVGYI